MQLISEGKYYCIVFFHKKNSIRNIKVLWCMDVIKGVVSNCTKACYQAVIFTELCSELVRFFYLEGYTNAYRQ